MVHDWRKGDEIGLVNHLKSVDFARLFQGKNVNAAWAVFKETIEEAIDRYIPFRSKVALLTSRVKNLINRKQRFWKKFSKSCSPHDFENYKLAEGLCKRVVSAKTGNTHPLTSNVSNVFQVVVLLKLIMF